MSIIGKSRGHEAGARMFDGIFWDNDGVLMETEHLYYRANAEALAQAGVELSLEEFCMIPLFEVILPCSTPSPHSQS
jgi:hypothetical protein